MHQTNQHFYDRIANAYDALADSNEHAARETGLTMLAAQPGWRVLEIGFGTGSSLALLAQSVGDSGHVDGVDVSPGMRDVAMRKLTEQKLSQRVSLSVGDAVELNFADASFDAVFMSFTLELFAPSDADNVLAEVLRVLKPGGYLANVSMSTVAKDQSESVLEKTYQWMHRHFPHIVDCRPIDAAALLNDSGFAIQQETRMDIWTMPVSAVLAQKPA
ncbi:demethylmenaquinone methyltransferase / 2-methoxy-6-polyprenyl-1,4-benzoquinol methylase [Neorhodopirellula lusitana]|uniref:Demethylmenaquinone methyltransferase / 2-methoxy-6-polyprenyl-1,4-benzoquinol methylase n=1 Tax=Neorhodopirellula lusitana TaxID=445327 RepID=A0ABY1Q2A3_9BACT|nr:methyltransferase domain-containing protein [Neorhodopirellula lusitana]SMP56979.1 demethylmenaquinone methyltransferase / 2-methoxy-6-polyprenyl-1,4-benzoquinol methylase [Neorhodopirellula lusitana]